MMDEFIIAPHNGFPTPAVAFDGSNYLAVFVSNGAILGIRVSSTGSVLDSNGVSKYHQEAQMGIQILSLTEQISWSCGINGTAQIMISTVP
jgi:hypothetical protein